MSGQITVSNPNSGRCHRRGREQCRRRPERDVRRLWRELDDSGQRKRRLRLQLLVLGRTREPEPDEHGDDQLAGTDPRGLQFRWLPAPLRTSATVVWGDPTPRSSAAASTCSTRWSGRLGSISYTDPSPVTFTYPYTFDDVPAGLRLLRQHGRCGPRGVLSFASDTASVEVCAGGSDLTVTKTASPSFTRTFGWDAEKSVDQLRQTVAARRVRHLQLPRRREQGRRCGFRLGGEWCDHGQQRERLGDRRRPGRQRPGWELCARADERDRSRQRLGRGRLQLLVRHRRFGHEHGDCELGQRRLLRPRAARPRRRPTTPSISRRELVNDSVQVYDNGNLLGPTDHSIQFSYPKSFPGTAGTCTTHDNTATVKNNPACSPPPTPSPSRCAPART